MANYVGRDRDGSKFEDNVQDSVGFGVPRPQKKTELDDRECIYDGRLLTPNVKFMQDTIRHCDPSKTNEKGGFGKVYFYKDKHPALGIPVAIKEVIIEETSQKLKMMSIINERLASRALHSGIVPLLAATEDIDKRSFYFLSPYMENGDLFQMLKDDTEKLNADRIRDVILTKQRRLKVLYHISSALDFLHTPVKDIRGPIIHMDVKSLNIVLDADYNARLIDFGLAREMHDTESGIPVTKTETGGTNGYFPTQGYSVLTKYEDYHNFGVVGLECLTGLPPHNPDDRDGDLRMQHKEKLRDKIQDIWLARDDIGPDAEAVLQLCIQCIASPSKKNISSAEICQKLLVLLQQQQIYSWDRKNKSENKCEICLINPAVADDVLTHKTNCLCNIAVCIACIRNSYVNYIKCHSCDADIFPAIGHFWAALLIIGNDVKHNEVASIFKKDIMEVHKLIVSMCPRVIGIRPENVFVVEAETPGLKGDLKPKLESAVEQMSKTDKIQTVLVYYSGHSDENGLDLENDEEYVTGNEFCTYMKRIFSSENTVTNSMEFRNAISHAVSPKRILCFLDCCHPPNLTSLHDPCVCVIQVNACRSKRQSMVETNGSVFTKFFIQALTQSAHGKECIDDQCDCTPIKGNFITVEQLVAYMRYHMKNYQRRRNIETYNAPEKHEMFVTAHDEKIAYNADFLVQLEFRFKDPDSGGDMIKKMIKPNFISDMQGLSRILFETFIENKFPALSFEETDIDIYQDCICVEIDKGPKEKEELDTIEKVMKAWNARRDLAVSLRRLSSIQRGMVLLILQPVKIQQFLEANVTASQKVCSFPSNISFEIHFADIPELKHKIGRKVVGELKVFKDHLSDVLNACKLEENENAKFTVILPNPEDKRKLPFVCYKMTIINDLQREGPTESLQSTDIGNEGVDKTVPKQVYGTSAIYHLYETSTNIETNNESGNKNTADRGGVHKSAGKVVSVVLPDLKADALAAYPMNIRPRVVRVEPQDLKAVALAAYPMNNMPRGWCVIINNKEFHVGRGDNAGAELPPRNGTEKDAESLQHTFSKLGFIIRRRDNLTDTEMCSFLIDVSHNVDHKDFDCFVCCILTHGVLNYVYGSNGKLLPIKELTLMFQTNRCESLAGKPKLFFLQACQGRDKMTGCEMEKDMPISVMEADGDRDMIPNKADFLKVEIDGPTPVLDEEHDMIPNEADFLLGYATVPGYVSFRSSNHGSWYIIKLCEMLDKYSARFDLMSILVEVNREVAAANAEFEGGLYKQIPAPLVTLRKQLFFR